MFRVDPKQFFYKGDFVADYNVKAQTTMFRPRLQCFGPDYNVLAQTTMFRPRLQCLCPDYNV